jgi:transcriptional regulator with XRE-family HTH domain
MATLLRELEAVERLHDEFGFTYNDLAAAVNTGESTLHRWRSGDGAPPTPVFLARLSALDAFLAELRRTFRKKGDARKWLDERVPALRGETPRQMILAGHVDRVTGVLYAVNAGIAT